MADPHDPEPEASAREADDSRPADWPVVDDTEAEIPECEAPAAVAKADERMSAVRVRQLSAERRGAYRLRSYCVIGAGLCAMLGIQLARVGIVGMRETGLGARQVGFACGAAAAGMAASFLVRRALDLTRELRKPAQHDPESPPDFSTLSDGSHHWKNLDEMHRGD
jgi:hypothetical protein